MIQPADTYYAIKFKDGRQHDEVAAIDYEETGTQHVFVLKDGGIKSYERAEVASVIETGIEPIFIAELPA